ncbi:hypothetical protein WOLCODRAFT_139004 [Wolfiporia cocos MD-104 SS10]|uniref:Transcription factor hoxa13 n=1 Tax=Wolfiporia cocos (strain MD-104) TaxID=742152 RepID=A0A2H3K2S1_WOLCO|nr:hypothetical protein WOLCODRAFT_139004 [Wolfiporia cocos MD-104 SS10]
MVVNRKTTNVPAPASRANSTSQLPRVKGKTPSTSPRIPDVSSPLANGGGDENMEQHDGVPENDIVDTSVKRGHKSKLKSKQKKGRKKLSRRGSGIVDLIWRIFLLWFTIYTISVCPQDTQLESPICRGLSAYHRLVIEPYILPPIKMAFAHPNVAPYVEKAKPYADSAIDIAVPVASRTLYEWNTRVVPQWNKRVVPLWRRHALPYIQKLDTRTTPYRTLVAEKYEHVGQYVRPVTPYIQQTAFTLQRVQQKTRPYVILAAHKTYDGYQRIAPYARPVWDQLKGFLLRRTAIIAETRRQYVDPHVQTIWEHVKELSSGKQTAPAPAAVQDTVPSRVSKAAKGATSAVSSLTPVPTSSMEAIVIASDAAYATASPMILGTVADSETLSSPAMSTSPTSNSVEVAGYVVSAVSGVPNSIDHIASSIYAAVSVSVSSVSSEISSLAVSSASLLASAAAESAYASATETLSSASSAASSVSARLSSIASSVGDGASVVYSQASSNVVNDVTTVTDQIVSTVQAAPSAVSSGIASVANQIKSNIPSAISAQDEDAEVDLDAFYAELGIEDIVTEGSTSTPGDVLPPVKTESDEEKAERQRLRAAQMADKRKDIMSRHTKWEEQLTAEIEVNKKALRKALITLRKAAAAELKESREIHAEIEGLVEEAEKLLKGADKYLQTLVKEGRTEDEKRTLWERVVDKVDQKFTERIGQTEAVVNGLYMQSVDAELVEVRKVADAVRDVADRGQADLGMDYAYLDDVTYNDWQRYHDLLRKSDNFTVLAHSIQDGTDPSPPINPVLKAIADLEGEVRDVVLGFETRLRRVKRNGERALGGGVQEIEDDDESTSILPIEDENKIQTPADVNVPQVVIGRTKEEILDALDRVAEQEGQATLSSQATAEASDPEQVALNLADDAAGETVLEPSQLTRNGFHEEL